MDSLTQPILGACTGKLVLGKSLGRMALLWSAVAQNLPDIDGVANLWLPVSEGLLGAPGPDAFAPYYPGNCRGTASATLIRRTERYGPRHGLFFPELIPYGGIISTILLVMRQEPYKLNG